MKDERKGRKAHSSFIILHSSLSSRPRGAARSARLPVTQEIVGSNPIGDASWHGTPTGRSAKLKPWCLWVRLPPVLLEQQHASAGHWRAQVAVTHPPRGCAGSTPARRTDNTARSSNGRIPGPQPGDAGSTPVRATYGEVVESVDTRRSERRARQGRGSSTLPFVTRRAGAAGAQLALIRPVSPVRYRGLQLKDEL